MVHFVGAGPGAADLITVRGLRLIEQADQIIYAGSLVNPELTLRAKEGCRVLDSAGMTLEQVIGAIRETEAAGGDTVRLHTGDPSIYGAIREQMDRLDENGIAYDVTPGVSAFSACAAALPAEFTLPGLSQTVILTRMAGRTPVPEKERMAELQAEQDKAQEASANVEKFMSIVHKYASFEELTPTLLREFVEKIVVHEAVALDGKRRGKQRTQAIEIYYSFVGKIDLPE